MRTVTIGNPPRVIGGIVPLVCVPIMPVEAADIAVQARLIASYPIQPDLVEIRIDPLIHRPSAEVRSMLREARLLLGSGLPILLTNRGIEEGGMATGELFERTSFLASIFLGRDVCVTQDAHDANVVKMATDSVILEPPIADLIDFELHYPDQLRQFIIQMAHDQHKYVVLSRHMLDNIPSAADMYNVAQVMERSDADIAKIAIMPATPLDVLECMRMTLDLGATLAKPLITMAMGSLGGISRLGGTDFCSPLTFATIGPSSAPGQLPIKLVREYWHSIGMRPLQDSPSF